MTKELPAHEILQRLFAIIVEEAQKKPALAKKLLAVFPQSVVAKVETAERRAPKFDPAKYNAVSLLRKHGEGVLRGQLEQIKNKENLRAVAKTSNLTLEGAAAKRTASVPQLIDGIIRAAKHYHKQRTGAAA